MSLLSPLMVDHAVAKSSLARNLNMTIAKDLIRKMGTAENVPIRSQYSVIEHRYQASQEIR